MSCQAATTAKARKGLLRFPSRVSALLRSCVLPLTFIAPAARSQPGPPRPPGSTYDPYQPLIRQGRLPDEVDGALQGVRLFPDKLTPSVPAAVSQHSVLMLTRLRSGDRSPEVTDSRARCRARVLRGWSPRPGRWLTAWLSGYGDRFSAFRPVSLHARRKESWQGQRTADVKGTCAGGQDV